MTITEILGNVPQTEKDQMLTALFSFAFENEEGELDLDRDISGGDFIELFSERAIAIINNAEETKKMIDETLESKFEESSLDEEVHDLFEGQASDVNNSGTSAQVQYLILNGHTPASIVGVGEGQPNQPVQGISE